MKNKTFIIAEVGPNHNGSFKLAQKMVKQISKTGVDCIKFQLADPTKFTVRMLSKLNIKN